MTLTCSPRITEYGSVKETKNGWKTVRVDGLATPIPVLDDMANALRCQLVMVSGTMALIVF